MTKGWTKAKRALAAEYGRMGNRAGKAAGGRLGGRMAWEMLSPEARAAVVERLRAARRPQMNESAKARAAQRERARTAVMADMSQAKAEHLAERGILKRVLAAPPSSVCAAMTPERTALEEAGRLAVLRATKPERANYPDHDSWIAAMKAWAAARP